MEKEIAWFKENLNKSHIHGRNILAKLQISSILFTTQKKQLQKVIEKYKEWNNNNEILTEYSDDAINQRVKWLNDYKNEIKNVDFSAQSKFHSTVPEEFLYYLARRLKKYN
ncbi:MAG: hypothetical protein CVT88_06170 [Candidatus Altiarchaeales archaeon HGW-Altiarchaeales-1]|nr:MAG: hypothetical protein CVT88_06170 [Candidatus Altiarchaeales archaeon HGW-Altiarchaeales-1]